MAQDILRHRSMRHRVLRPIEYHSFTVPGVNSDHDDAHPLPRGLPYIQPARLLRLLVGQGSGPKRWPANTGKHPAMACLHRRKCRGRLRPTPAASQDAQGALLQHSHIDHRAACGRFDIAGHHVRLAGSLELRTVSAGVYLNELLLKAHRLHVSIKLGRIRYG